MARWMITPTDMILPPFLDRLGLVLERIERDNTYGLRSRWSAIRATLSTLNPSGNTVRFC